MISPEATENHLRNVHAASLQPRSLSGRISIARSIVMYQSVTATGISRNGAFQR